MDALNRLLDDGANLNHEVRVVLDDDLALKIALVLVGAILLNVVARKIVGV